MFLTNSQYFFHYPAQISKTFRIKIWDIFLLTNSIQIRLASPTSQHQQRLKSGHLPKRHILRNHIAHEQRSFALLDAELLLQLLSQRLTRLAQDGRLSADTFFQHFQIIARPQDGEVGRHRNPAVDPPSDQQTVRITFQIHFSAQQLGVIAVEVVVHNDSLHRFLIANYGNDKSQRLGLGLIRLKSEQVNTSKLHGKLK